MSSLPEIDPKLSQALFQNVVEGLFVDGHLEKHDLSDQENLLKKVLRLLKNSEISIVIDHRDKILDAAIRYQSEDNYDFSLTFYATFFEHTINHIISRTISKKKISKKAADAVIRSANIDAKFGWLLELIGLPALNTAHRGVVIRVSDARNAFVHYKWNPAPDELSESEKKRNELKTLLLSARKTASYLQRYEAKCLFAKQKGRVRSITRLPKKSLKQTLPRNVA